MRFETIIFGILCAKNCVQKVMDIVLSPMYATDKRQTDVRRASSLNASALWVGGTTSIRQTDEQTDREKCSLSSLGRRHYSCLLHSL